MHMLESSCLVIRLDSGAQAILDCFGKKNLEEGLRNGKACSMIDGDGQKRFK